MWVDQASQGPSSRCPRKMKVLEYRTVSPDILTVGGAFRGLRVKHMSVLLEGQTETPGVDAVF